MSFCAQHNKKHLTNTECQNMNLQFLEEKEQERVWLAGLADQVQSIHQETNIDGYGDEGAGYDYVEQVRLLIIAGWKPPERKEDG